MPPKPKNEPEPGSVNTDSLAQDVADEELEYPEGTPELRPLLKLPRRRRKDAYELLGQLQTLQRQLKPDDDEAEDNTAKVVDPKDWGKNYEVVVLIEDYLRIVAADEPVFEAWVTEISDSDLVATFKAFQRKTQPGEAESSTG